jgi:hypothetical protein
MIPGNAIGFSVAALVLAGEQQTRTTAELSNHGERKHARKEIPFCPVLQRLRQCENRDEIRFFASGLVQDRLLCWCESESDKRGMECG